MIELKELIRNYFREVRYTNMSTPLNLFDYITHDVNLQQITVNDILNDNQNRCSVNFNFILGGYFIISELDVVC